MTTTDKPKRKRRTKAEIEADKLKAKEELFNKEYLPLNIPTILTVQQLAKLLKSTVKETRDKCVNSLFICEPHESEKNQWNIPTYQFIEEENFSKFIKSYLKQLEINQVITPKTDIKEESDKKVKTSTTTKTIKNKTDDNVVVEGKSTSKTKKIEDIKIDDVKLTGELEILNEEIKQKRKRNSKKDIQKEVLNENKTDNDKNVVVEEPKKLSAKEKEQLSKLESFIQNKQQGLKIKNTFEVPMIPAHAHYSINDNVKLLNEFVLGEDCDGETLDYMEYYKKHLFGKKGVITKIEFAAKGHIIYTVYFEKYKEEMYCYHHYLEWLS